MKKTFFLLLALFGSGAVFADETLTASKDSFLMRGPPNKNVGAHKTLRLHANDQNRAVVGFDLTGISLEGLEQAQLVLTISSIGNNWGPYGRPVRAHRLLETFTEGNGSEELEGTGAGVSWNCASDLTISNLSRDCATSWNGGSFAPATAPAVVHRNPMTGEVAFDVTEDVLALGPGATEALFLVKKEDGPGAGHVEYWSREGNPSLGPKLVLVGVHENQPPIARDDFGQTLSRTSVDLQVLANDSDPNGDALTVTSVGDPAKGTAVLHADGTITYTPDAGQLGVESFPYTVSDGRGGTASATVLVSIFPRPPVAQDDFAATEAEKAVVIAILANDAEVEQAFIQIATPPSNGTAVLNADRSVTYSPGAGFSGEDRFVYSVTNGIHQFSSATVTVTVTPRAEYDEAATPA